MDNHNVMRTCASFLLCFCHRWDLDIRPWVVGVGAGGGPSVAREPFTLTWTAFFNCQKEPESVAQSLDFRFLRSQKSPEQGLYL
jgi:hypothetical protein